MEAAWDHTIKVKFRGSKLHAVVNQLGLPLRILVTPENRYDGPYLPKLIWNLDDDFVLPDEGYDSKQNTKAVLDIAAKPVIADNPRRKGKSCKVEHNELLVAKRYLVEQFNGHLKANVLRDYWVWTLGLVKKTAMVEAGLIIYNVETMRSLIAGKESLK